MEENFTALTFQLCLFCHLRHSQSHYSLIPNTITVFLAEILYMLYCLDSFA
jgi:hypothetical protein